MAILKGILKDGLDYYRELDQRYRARLKELPIGSVLKRRIGRKDYYYLIYRSGGRVISRYLGKEEPIQMEKDIKERRLIKKQMKEVRENLLLLRRLEKRKKNGRSLSKNT
ncbi:MAG TPA: hypothetical protein VN915_11700 [Elusimicrobiota bacterium]|nr:hypothetical protein [Elusimicrobiota bacterium]